MDSTDKIYSHNMTSKTSIVAVLMIISMATSSSTCKKHFGCAENIYSFQIGIKAYPDKDSIYISDTVWLEINAPTQLKDMQSGMMINYNEAENLGTGISFVELIKKDTIKDAGDDFNYVIDRGIPVSNPRTTKVRGFVFEEQNFAYYFKVGIIPKKRGTYKMFVSNAANVYRKMDKCTKANFEINFENTNQHLYYNKIILPNYDLPPGGGVYLFKII